MKISPKVAKRTFIYLRSLENLLREGKITTSSKEISQRTGFSHVTVRKDISHFAKLGKPRIGYNVIELKSGLDRFLLGGKTVNIALFGAGNLGTALLKYPALKRNKLNIVAAFDKDTNKISTTINGTRIFDIKKAKEIISKKRIVIAILAVSEKNASDVAKVIISSGIKAILNFSPASLNVGKHICVKNIDLSIEFKLLFCLASNAT